MQRPQCVVHVGRGP
uniref:Uncharacterized protein n=1 Tax=Anguilla anguilla TaxID=7936 RepID=A0A0E9UVY2_ANGAN